jgi:acyl dehydratase
MSDEARIAEIQAILDRRSPETTDVVELDAVRRFAEAVGDPIVDDTGRVLVPPTFLGALRYRRPPMPPCAEGRMVIVENALTLARLPVVGERITTSARFTSLAKRGPLLILKLVCTYKDGGGTEIAAFACSWIVDVEDEEIPAVPVVPRLRAELPGGNGTIGQTSVNGHGGPDPREVQAWEAVDLSALEPGDQVPPLVKAPLTTLQFAKYAGASHDFNPIHYDSHCAGRAGFPDVVAPGLLKMAFFGEHMTLWAGRWGQLRRLESRYRGPDFPGARLTSCGSVRSVEKSGDGQTVISVDLALRDEEGEESTVGRAIIDAVDAGTR